MLKRLLQLIWVTGLRLKCPVCRQGDLFASFTVMHKTCAHCGVRFQRDTGEEAGGMTLSIVVLGVIFLVVYPLTEILTDLPLAIHLAVWLPFCILFPIAFYRYSRALWVVFLYYTDAVRADNSDYRDSDLTLMDAFRHGRDAHSAEPPEERDH